MVFYDKSNRCTQNTKLTPPQKKKNPQDFLPYILLCLTNFSSFSLFSFTIILLFIYFIKTNKQTKQTTTTTKQNKTKQNKSSPAIFHVITRYENTTFYLKNH